VDPVALEIHAQKLRDECNKIKINKKIYIKKITRR
jgi:hypothetical protein